MIYQKADSSRQTNLSTTHSHLPKKLIRKKQQHHFPAVLRGPLPRDRRFTPLCTLQLPQLWENNGIIFTSNASKFTGLMSWLTASGNTVFPITTMSCFIDGWISTEASMRHSTTYYYWNQCPCPQRFMIVRCTALWCKWNVVWCHMMLLRFKLFSKK